MADDDLFLGLDLSTQQLKVVLTDASLQLKYETAVKFDDDLPEFGTDGGAHVHEDKCTVSAPVLMWVKALDLCLDKMKNDGVDFSKIIALSGDGQQHGSVYWGRGALTTLKELKPEKTFHEQLVNSFAVKDSPIWLDGSTDMECKMLEDSVGGPLGLAKLTGARCFHRFTGSQIARIYRLYPDKYNNTERISLVSSLIASLFLGRYAPIDQGDGSGLSLMDIYSKQWHQKLLQTCAPDLEEKLGENPVPSYSVLGTVSCYLVSRFGFRADCKVIAFTGDNMASVAGLRLQAGQIMVTLGTSDCVIPVLTSLKPNVYSCQIIHPVLENAYIALLCFKNSSLTRERIMKERAGSWDKFNQLLDSTPCGNNGNIGIYFHIREITPTSIGVYRFDSNDKQVDEFDAATEVRAVLESQFLARRMYAENCGIDMASTERILATGGASANKPILQLMSDVFGMDVYTIDIPNSACLGNCYRAKHGYLGGAEKVDFFSILPEVSGLQCAAKPNTEATKIYDRMIQRYRRLEKKVADEC